MCGSGEHEMTVINIRMSTSSSGICIIPLHKALRIALATSYLSVMDLCSGPDFTLFSMAALAALSHLDLLSAECTGVADDPEFDMVVRVMIIRRSPYYFINECRNLQTREMPIVSACLVNCLCPSRQHYNCKFKELRSNLTFDGVSRTTKKECFFSTRLWQLHGTLTSRVKIDKPL